MPKGLKLEAEKKARDLLERYDRGEISSIQELVDEAERINNTKTQKAIDAFRRFQEEDRILKGRADWDEAETQFLDVLKAIAQKCVSRNEGRPFKRKVKERLSSNMKALLDNAISENRPIESVIIFSRAEREYLKKAGYILEGDKYVSRKGI